MKHPSITLARQPVPVKLLATCIIFTLGLGMIGALAQIIVHDIIPTFYVKTAAAESAGSDVGHAGTSSPPAAATTPGGRGDLFADLVADLAPEKAVSASTPFYRHEQFVWTLKWTHIHLFGMGMIFILLGLVTIGLDASPGLRAWLVVLPFAGVWLDILAMWLKVYVSPVFFWLHVPGGGLFAMIFAYVSLRALREMWARP